jgi:phosphoribosylformylglycinamidine synthase
MKFGVLVFPGSNCDHDTYNVIAEVAHQPVTFLWHDSEDLEGVDAVLVPGGFAYGDYLRTGAIARFSPVMQSVKRFAAGGGLVLGIWLKYICRPVHLRVETADSPFTSQLAKGEVLQLPIGHMEGNYFCEPGELEKLEAEDRIAFRYATPRGEITKEANPNGSLSNIAGILNESRNVLGMMPHPDRSSELLLGSADGWKIFASMVEALAAR